MSKTILAIIVLLITLNIKGVENMDTPIYNLQAGSYFTFPPKTYPNPDIYFGYSIPVDNAIATKNVQTMFSRSRYNVAIYKFDDNSLDRDEVISGDLVNGIFPAFNDNVVPIDGHRSIELYDVKKGKFLREMMVCDVLEETIENFGVIDGEMLIGLVEIIYLGNDDINKRFLKIFDFSGDKPKLLAEKEIYYGDPDKDKWLIYDNKIIVYNRDYIKAYDFNFKETTHPLVEAFNSIVKKDFRFLDELIIHPKLPFALIVEIEKDARKNYKVWVLCWDKDPEKCLYKLILKDRYPEHFMFSPDGKWVVFNDVNILNNDLILYTMPVDTALPHYVAQPIVLGNIGIDYQKNMWTRNPMSFVRIGFEEVFRWEFDKLAEKLRNRK